MAFDLIRVAIFGQREPDWLDQLRIAGLADTEAAEFDARLFANDTNLLHLLADFRPQVLVSFGPPESFPQLWRAPLEVRRRWLSFVHPAPAPDRIADAIMNAYLTSLHDDRFPDEPLVSVITPAYLSGEKIVRPMQSLLRQTYTNWEWVIYDDSPDAGQTFERLSILCQQDQRMMAFRAGVHSGNIGEVKRRAFGLGTGQILVELDHDDELAPSVLTDIVDAAQRFPDAGFFYSDYAGVFEGGGNATHGEGWGFGFGSYRQEVHDGRALMVTNFPSINAKTIRHIVGVPNHVRAWTREAYFAAGGHNPQVHVCDDYELLIRTFLTTRMVHIQRLGYIQYFNNASTGNTHRDRNKEIQRLVRYFRRHYNERIHERLLALGVDDFIWQEDGDLDWSAPNPDPTPIANYIMR